MNLTSKLGTMRSYAIALIGGVLLLGGYSQRSEAADCEATGTFQDLIGAVSCTIGDKTFSNFSTLGDLGDTGANINYAAIDGVDGQWGFRFQFNLFASGGEGGPVSSDQAIAYRVACTNGSDCIDSIHALIVGSIASSVDSETGFEDFFGGFLQLGENYSGVDFDLQLPGGPSSYDKDFTPVSFLDIAKDLNATCAFVGTTNEPNDLCVVSLSYMENTVDQVSSSSSGDPGSSGENGVPEPASLSLIAAGLMGLGLYRRRRNNSV